MRDEPSEPTTGRDLQLTRRGDTAPAGAALREARSTAASFDLAQLLEERGDGRGAIAAFQRAVRRGHAAPKFELGGLLAVSDDPRGLIKAYRVAAGRGDQGAAYQLGLLYLERGEIESARSAFAGADKLGHGWAAFGLGEILEQTGDRSGAIAAYRRAARRRVTAAHARLEALLGERGEADEGTSTSGVIVDTGSTSPTNRWTRPRLARIVGTVVVLAALLVVVLVALLPSGHTTSGPGSPTAPTTRARAGGVGNHLAQSGRASAFAPPTIGFTVKQSALLDSVPGAAHAQCFPQAKERLPRSDASISCFSPSAAVTVVYYRYSSLPIMRSVFHNYRAWFASHHKLRDCAGGTHGKYFQGSAGAAIAGRWACFYNDRTIPQSACIDWVNYGLLTFGSACQADENFTALSRWWTHAGPVPASTPGLANRL